VEIDTCQVVELRRYALRPDGRETLIELFDRELVETQEAVGMSVLGQFRDLDDPDSFVWLRGFTDMRARKRGLELFYGGPVWKAHASAANATMVDSDNVLLLRPLSGLELDTARRAAPGSASIPPGLLVVAIYPLAESAAGSFPELFARDLEPALRQTGASVLATYVTEHSPNTFPALPVRDDQEVFVWMGMFVDEADHARHVAELERSPSWRDGLAETLAQSLAGSPEVLRLTPTARSLLHR
jgi:quinol monooxygenase YgiN